MEKDEIIVNEIIASAKLLFQQYGLQKTTMEDIAKAAGKGKSTLYYYFKSKDQIFNSVVELEMDDFFTTVKDAVDKEDDVQAKLKIYILHKITTLKHKTNLYRLTIKSYTNKSMTDLFIQLRDRYDHKEITLLSAILEKGIENKIFSKSIEKDITLLSELMISGIRGVEMDMISRNKYNDLDSKVNFLSQILIKGLS